MTKPDGRRIGHLDMDAFFAAVEQLDDPSLRGKPVIVGGLGPRGVVSTASYEARPFGVGSALPMAVARRRCPQGAFLRPRFARYKEISDRIRSILRSVTGAIETISLDEAFFDLSGRCATFEEAEEVVRNVKHRVRIETDLTCSVGLGPNRFLAKIASELDKPDGFCVIRPESVREVLDPMPVGRIWGVGKVTERRLQGLGILRVEDLRLAPPSLLERELGSMGKRLQQLARGEDDTPVGRQASARSISREVTFAHDLTDLLEIEEQVRSLAADVAVQLQREQLLCHTVRVKIRFPDFRTVTRQVRLAVGVDSAGFIEQLAVHLLYDRVPLRDVGVRLIGVGVADLSISSARQLSLFEKRAAEESPRHPALG